jgi:lipopolysaccharide export system permease protein
MTPRRLDRYLLALMLRPVLACMAVSLVAVLLKRLLEVVTQIAQEGGQILIWRLVASMVSIYASDLLPAAFLFGIFLVIAKLGDDAEIDAMLASGVSIGRLAAPFLATGLTLTLASIVLFGFLQPYGRYGYKAALFAASNAGWSAEVEPGAFLDPGDGYVITADRVHMSGHRLEGVFIRRALPGGGEQVTTARSGELRPLDGGRAVMVRLSSGAQLELKAGKSRVRSFETAQEVASVGSADSMRARGVDPRELTLPELIRSLRGARTAAAPRAVAAELYVRIAQTLAVPFLPLMAIPLGMAAKRGRRVSGLILGAMMLLAFRHGLLFTRALAQTGLFSPGLAIGAVFLAWAALCVWVFATSQQRPGDNPVTRLMDALQARLQQLRELFSTKRTTTDSLPA